MTTQSHTHYIAVDGAARYTKLTASNHLLRESAQGDAISYRLTGNAGTPNISPTASGGGQNTGTASPSTENLGNGTAITIQPQYITLKFWKRLT